MFQRVVRRGVVMMEHWRWMYSQSLENGTVKSAAMVWPGRMNSRWTTPWCRKKDALRCVLDLFRLPWPWWLWAYPLWKLLLGPRVIPTGLRPIAGDQTRGEKWILLSPSKQTFANFDAMLFLIESEPGHKLCSNAVHPLNWPMWWWLARIQMTQQRCQEIRCDSAALLFNFLHQLRGGASWRSSTSVIFYWFSAILETCMLLKNFWLTDGIVNVIRFKVFRDRFPKLDTKLDVRFLLIFHAHFDSAYE